MSHGYSVHEGVSCDGCGHTNFGGNRYKCLRCIDFDLCHQCFAQKRYPNSPQAPDHQENHPMQMILTPRDFEIIYDGDPNKNYDVCKIGSFTCPICNLCGLNLRTFAAHVGTHPATPDLKVICPLCIAFPGDSNTQYPDLKDHIITIHSHLDSAYRTEPQVRATSRRPVLARRTQRQPAGQAGTFAQQNLGISLGTLGWPAEDMEEMFRFAQLNRQNVMGTAGNVQQMIGIAGQAMNSENQAAVLQTIQREQASLQRAMMMATQPGHHRTAPASRHSEYAQPRHSAPRQPSVMNQPIARLVRTTPIFPSNQTDDENNASSDDAGDLTGDENDFGSGDEAAPPLENDSLDGDVASTSAEAGGSDYIALLSDNNTSREPSIKKPSTTSADTDSEFDFDKNCEEDESSEESEENEVEEPVERKENGVEVASESLPAIVPTEKEIIASLRSHTTEAEFRQVMRTMHEEDESDDDDDDEGEGEHMDPGPESGDSSEEQLEKLVWAKVKFEVPPLNTFGSSDNWNDKRFLRHRKLHRELSSASTMEDTLEKTDVVLSLVQVAAGGNSDRCRVFDKPDRSVRRSLADLKLSDRPPRVRHETVTASSSSMAAPEINPQELVGNETNGTNGICAPEPEKETNNTTTVKFRPSEEEEPPSPTDGESSEDDEERSFRQDDVQFIEELRQ